MSTKRKHVTLTLNQKHEIINKIDKGQTLAKLARAYGVGKSTIYDIKVNRDKIIKFMRTAEGSRKNRKTVKTGEHPEMENTLYSWFVQQTTLHAPLTGDILREKAKYYYEKMTKKNNFRASEGWLDRFKKRFGIRFLTDPVEKSSCNDMHHFHKMLKTKIQELGLLPEQVYIAADSDLFWKMFPYKIFIRCCENSGSERKMSLERLTFMPCTNSTGTHKLPLLVVGKSKKLRAFTNLPVIYKYQAKGWLTQDIFGEWFKNDFIPAVKTFSKDYNLPAKALLILDYAPGNLNDEVFNSENLQIQVLYMPPNASKLLEPIYQNVNQQIKMNYNKCLLLDLLKQTNGLTGFLKEVNLKDAAFNLAYSWNKVRSKCIESCWKKVWRMNPVLDSEEVIDNYDQSHSMLQLSSHFLQDLSKRCEVKFILTSDDIKNWILGTGQENSQYLSKEEFLNQIDSTNDEGEDKECQGTAAEQTVSDSEAFDAFNICMKWAEKNSIESNDILVLKRLQECVFDQMFCGT